MGDAPQAYPGTGERQPSLMAGIGGASSPWSGQNGAQNMPSSPSGSGSSVGAIQGGGLFGPAPQQGSNPLAPQSGGMSMLSGPNNSSPPFSSGSSGNQGNPFGGGGFNFDNISPDQISQLRSFLQTILGQPQAIGGN